MATFPQLDSNMDPDQIDKTSRGGPGVPYTPGIGGPTQGFGGYSPGSQMGRNPMQTPFSPQRRLYGQAYGGTQGRSMSPTTNPASAAFAATRTATPARVVPGNSGKISPPGVLGKLAPATTVDKAAYDPGPNPYAPGTPEYEMWKNYHSKYESSKSGNAGMLGNEAINQMIAAGMFNPGGSQPMIDALYGQARGDADALRQRSNTLAQLSGMDPSQAASSYFQRDMSTEGEIQRMLLNARLQSMTQNRALLESVGTSGMNAAYQNWLSNNQFNRNKSL
jgi:hypothetical protein